MPIPTQQINIKGFPVELCKQLKDLADDHGRSVDSEIVHALYWYIRVHEKHSDLPRDFKLPEPGVTGWDELYDMGL